MIDAGIGRLLVASLHQGISDILPSRLEFYEAWLNPAGLRDRRIGLAPLTAVLSFLRQEGDVYQLVVARAGEYTAEWTVADLSAMHRAVIRRAPRGVRVWMVMRVARRMVRRTYTGSRVVVRWRGGEGTVDLRGSIFCRVRERVPHALCGFYASAIHRLMALFDIDADVGVATCCAVVEGRCALRIGLRVVRAEAAA